MNKPQWSSINVTGIINNNQSDITFFYNVMSSWLSFLTHGNDEVKNDIFMKLLAKLPQFDPTKGKLHNFLFTVATNQYKEQLKERKRKIHFVEGFEMLVHTFTGESDSDSSNELHLHILDGLSPQDHRFLLDYITCRKKDQSTADRKKFAEIKKRIRLL
jgi:DNA-directed RNA polymerase specialized sigma24 family protein